MTTIKETWEAYRDNVLLVKVRAEGRPDPPPAIIEAFRRTYYCGAASVFMSIVKADATLRAGPMDPDVTFKELQEFAAEMRTP